MTSQSVKQERSGVPAQST